MLASIARDLVATAHAFLDESHRQSAAALATWCIGYLLPRDEPVDDDAARLEARKLLSALGEARWLVSLELRDLRALAIVRELVAAASPLADAVVALQALGAMPLVLAGTDAQRARWLPRILDGRIMAGFAMTEAEAGSDVASLQARAHRVDAGWVLDGEKHLISNAGLADVYVVFAVTTPGAGSRGISAFVVPADAPGLTFGGAQKMAAPHPLGRLRLDGCRLAADALLGPIDGGFKIGMMALDRLRPTVGASACGMAARALAEAVRHAVTRRQFGRPLGELQLVRAKIGQMATELAAARLLVYRAAWMQDRGAERISVEAAMAKSFATEAAQQIVDEAVQIFGGRGVLLGNPVERLYRSVRALRIYEGATDVQRLIVGGALLKEATTRSEGN
jgi:acyl-CoA dehydrogenase